MWTLIHHRKHSILRFILLVLFSCVVGGSSSEYIVAPHARVHPTQLTTALETSAYVTLELFQVFWRSHPQMTTCLPFGIFWIACLCTSSIASHHLLTWRLRAVFAANSVASSRWGFVWRSTSSITLRHPECNNKSHPARNDARCQPVDN